MIAIKTKYMKKLPKKCISCRLFSVQLGFKQCAITSREIIDVNKKLEDCPLVVIKR